jgi:SpoVK/Ycf46/Vps4 family AAA+-type ATPase
VPHVNGVPESLELIDSPRTLADVCLRPTIRGDLELLIQEWKHRTSLQEKGLCPRRRLLFHGPPGCGKSLSAAALGRELGLPVYVVRFDGLIASLLGQTAVNLRTLFDHCSKHPLVLLIDEIDALGRHRGQRSDVGELDRVVISLMQELEHSHSDGLVIATCNLPDDLDAAVWRRFDAHLEFPLPLKAEILRYAKEKTRQFTIPFTRELRDLLSKRMSYADAERLVEDKARRLILKEV